MILQQPIKLAEEEELFKCKDCNEVKESSEYYYSKVRFYKSTGLPTRYSYCKACQIIRVKLHNFENKKEIQNHKRIKAYGISTEDYEAMYKKQKEVCKICKHRRVQLGRSGNIMALNIDHNHDTGRVRGLLCHKCNLSLGNFEDKVAYLLRAIYYLLRDRFITLVSLK